jgi:signal transduction histidine kinase
MCKFILVLVGSLGVVNGFSQTKMIDSLKRQLEKYTQVDTSVVNILNELSYQYQGINYYRALKYANQADKLADSLSFTKGKAMAQNRLAHCYWILGDSELAIEKALKGVAIAEKKQFDNIQAESNRLLGVTYTDLREYDKAQNYFRKAEKICLQTNNWDVLTRVYTGEALIQTHKQKYDTAMLLFNKSLMIARKYNLTFYLPLIYSNMGGTFSVAHPEKLEEGFTIYKKALSLAKKEQNRFAEAGVLNHIGNYYLKLDKFKEADEFLRQSLNIAREMGLKITERNLYINLIDLKIRQEDFWGAHGYMKNYYSLKDSILNEKKIRQIVELEARYEAEKKERKIELLEKEGIIQTTWRYILIVGMVLIGIIYFLQHSRTNRTKELLKTQNELNAKLKETDELKTKFFANISHEFRTPLTLILAPIEDKINSPLTSSSDKEGLLLVRRNANRLLDLVNQLLDLSKLKVGKMELQLKKGNIHEFLHVLVASFNSLAESRQILFSKNLLVPTREVEFDADKLEKIISNILFNAFKFTQPGGTVTISAQVSITGEISLEVADTGKGIPEEDQAHVFSPFYQSKHTFDDGRIGTGLGLALVSELVKIYNGEIKLTSKVSRGTTISVTIPSQFSNRLTHQEDIAQPFNQN